MLRAFVLFGALLGIMGCLGSAWAAADEDAVRPLGIGLEGIAYPYPVQFLDLVIEGQAVRMAYMDVLPTGAGNGKTAVLLHGKSFSGNYWETAIRRLTDEGYRVVVPDQIGFGKSSKPDIRYSFDLLAANTKKLLDTLGIRRAAIIGHSFGGMLAVYFARTYPDMLRCWRSKTRLDSKIIAARFRLSLSRRWWRPKWRKRRRAIGLS